jgi:uncharacterized membrane protein YkoI
MGWRIFQNTKHKGGIVKQTWQMLLLILASASMAYAAEEPAQKTKHEKIPLAQVPEAVRKAAAGAVKGIVLAEAEKETSPKGVVIFELEGKAGGKEYEIKVDAAGKVLKVELEDEDDEDKDDDD